jgi:hypothetical protein
VGHVVSRDWVAGIFGLPQLRSFLDPGIKLAPALFALAPASMDRL